MLTSLFLTVALTGGQPPAYYPPGVYPTAQPAQPETLPMTAPPNGDVPMTTPENGTVPGAEEEGPKEEEAPEKYLLERTLAQTRLGQILENRGITVYGWTAMSYTPSTTSRDNLPMALNDRANRFLLNQNWLHVERTLDTEKDEFQWGWVTDWILPGSDARFTVPRGLWGGQFDNGELYGFDTYQFYAQAWLPGIGQGTQVIVGRFATHCGYELVQQVDTPFVSRSYFFQYNPFTHTGVWATTRLNDDWTVGYGAATGNDTFIDPANRFTYLGRLQWAPEEGRTAVSFNTVLTDPRYHVAEDFAFYNVYNLVVTHKLSDNLTYVLDGGYSHIDDVPDLGFANWYGAANYLIYSINDRLSTTFRAEVFDDPQGFRTGFEGLYTEATWGFAWLPVNGLMIRPSVRYDYNGYSRPFEGDHHLWTGALEAIVRW